jgi:outer membrane biogenesis lipoprotein LolB
MRLTAKPLITILALSMLVLTGCASVEEKRQMHQNYHKGWST